MGHILAGLAAIDPTVKRRSVSAERTSRSSCIATRLLASPAAHRLRRQRRRRPAKVGALLQYWLTGSILRTRAGRTNLEAIRASTSSYTPRRGRRAVTWLSAPRARARHPYSSIALDPPLLERQGPVESALVEIDYSVATSPPGATPGNFIHEAVGHPTSGPNRRVPHA